MSSSPSRRTRVLLPIALLLPLVAFLLLRQAVGNATGALAITDAIPAVWVLAVAIWRRRIEWIALASVAVFALALVLTIAFGGSSLPLELRRSVFPGAVGLACLISLAAHRPLLATASTTLAARSRRIGAEAPKFDTPGARKTIAILTAMIGVTFLADAAAQIALALTLSTSAFAEVARFASYAIFATGLTFVALYLYWARAHGLRAPDVESPTRRDEPASQR